MTTEKFFKEIYPILESWMDVYKKTNNAALGESLERYLSMYESMKLPADIRVVVKEFRKQKQKIEKSNRLTAFVKRNKKIVGRAALVALLASGSVWALNRNDSKDVAKAASEQSITFDNEYWNRDPLTSETLINEGIEIKKMLAANGLFEDGKFSNEELAFYAFMSGIDAKTDSRIASLKLSEIVADKTVAETMLDKRTQALETGLMTKEFKADWSKIYPKKYEADILNELQRDYENILAKDNAENRQAINETLDKIMNNSTGYGEEASLDIIAYVNVFRGLEAQTDKHDNSYITEEKHDTFVDYMYETCLNVDTKSPEFVKQKHNLYDDVKTRLLEKVDATLMLERETLAISDGDKSLKEIAVEISKVKVENKTFNGMSASKKASEESKKDAQRQVEKDYSGEKVTSKDKIVTGSNGNKVIVSDKEIIVDKKGDTEKLPNKDENGNETTQSADELKKLGQQGAADYYKFNGDESKISSKNKNNPAYMAGWNAAKEADAKIDKEDKIDSNQNEIYYDDKQQDTNTSNPTTPEPSTPNPTTPENKPADPVVDEIVSEETETEDIIWGDYIIGTDGNRYEVSDISTEPELEGRSR